MNTCSVPGHLDKNERGVMRAGDAWERQCDRPLVESAKPPAYYCDCLLGWRMKTHETVPSKPGYVVVKESVLRGSSRCVFEVRVV